MTSEPMRRRTPSRARFAQCLFSGLLAVLLAVLLTTVGGLKTAHAADPVMVTIDNSHPIRLPRDAVGINTPNYDARFVADPNAPGLAAQLGTVHFRFPGGSNADYYHWQENQADGNVPLSYYGSQGDPLWPFT